MTEGFLAARSVLSLKGNDATGFLQGLVTQDVTGAAPAFAALLTPQGKILFDFFLVPVESGYLIDIDSRSAPALLKRLAMYKLRAKVALETEEGLCVLLGDHAGVRYSDPRHSALPVRTIAAGTGAAPADDAYDAARMALGVPEFGRDFVGEEVFLLDVNYDALNAVSYKKGCFVGQEVTSRMKRKGEIRKRTMIVHGGALAEGAPVTAGDQPIGEVMSVIGEAGLALIRTDRLADAQAAGVAITIAGAPATVARPPYL